MRRSPTPKIEIPNFTYNYQEKKGSIFVTPQNPCNSGIDCPISTILVPAEWEFLREYVGATDEHIWWNLRNHVESLSLAIKARSCIGRILSYRLVSWEKPLCRIYYSHFAFRFFFSLFYLIQRNRRSLESEHGDPFTLLAAFNEWLQVCTLCHSYVH